MLRSLTVALLLLAVPAWAQTGAGAEATGFDAVRQGLVHEMKASAEDLEADRRHKSTKALDRALHLAEFATSTFVLGRELARPFHDAHQAVKDARHALQMGRPEDTVQILVGAATALEGAPLPDVPDSGLKAEHAAEVEGHRVLNARGHMLGEIDGFVEGEDGPYIALVGHGGLAGLGERIVKVPLGRLIGARNFVVIPMTISPKEFAGMAAIPQKP